MDNAAKRIEAIFAEAVAQPGVDQRVAYLAIACRDDSQLRSRVEALLKAHDNAGRFMAPGEEQAATIGGKPHGFDFDSDPLARPGGPSEGAPPAEQPGTVIGRYKLLQQIGEGGFGVVYMAEQETPVKRRVALKIIKAGMDTKGVIARFEAERQALAMMDHPNIARVLDAGATDAGRPYFVMELVRGIRITDYCDQATLDTEQRLGLFMDVCGAVQHAHQKGVIHRDLKPSNIMVTLRDDQPIVKVIDFGIAKATEQKLTEKTLFTAYGQMIGTPAYMSPEQAAMSEFDVDTRSDVYSLGVLLYELLVGSPPFDVQTLRKAGFDEMRRIIREQQPQKPSTKLSTLTEELKLTVAGQRRVNPQALSRQLHGDLDWIVLKALEKDRTRRYESASAFAQDIRRHLKTEPVLAAAPSAGYRLGKFMQRNKGPMAVAAAIALLLLGGTAVSTWQAIRATRAKAVAVAAVIEKGKALEAANQANVQAQKRLSQIEKANDILGSIFESLDPKEIARADRPLQAILVEKLDKAVEQLQGEAIGDPLVVATMQCKFGASLLDLGAPNKAITLFKQASDTQSARLGPNHPDTLTSMLNLAGAYLAAGNQDQAVPLFEEVLARTSLGPDQRITLDCKNGLAVAYAAAGKMDLAVPMYEQTLKLSTAKLGPNHIDTLVCMGNLALAYKKADKLDLALPLLEESLRRRKTTLGLNDPSTLESMVALGGAYRDAGKLDLALPLLEEAFKLAKTKLGPDHSITLDAMNSLALAYWSAKQLDKSIPMFEEELKRREAAFGRSHPGTILAIENLGESYKDAGRLDKALPLLEEALNLRRAKLGPDHPDTLHAMNVLAQAYRAAGKLDLAVPLFEETLKLSKAKLGPDHHDTLVCMNRLGEAYEQTGRPDLFLPLAEETLKLSKAKLGPDHPDTLLCMGNLARAYLDAREIGKSIPLFEDTLKREEAVLGPDNPNTLTTMGNLAQAYRSSGRPDKAIPLFEEVVKGRKAIFGIDHSQTLTAMWCLAQVYDEGGKMDLALPLYEETLRRRKAKLGPDDRVTLTTMNDLAAVYWRVKRLDKSIPLFEETLKRMEAKFGPEHPQTLETASNLGVNYKDAGRLAEALHLLEMAYQAAKKHPRLRGVTPNLLDAYARAGKTEQATALAKEMLEAMRADSPAESPELAGQLATIASSLLQAKAYAAAEPLLRECLAIRAKTQPDDWTTFNTRSMLGGALLGQKEYAEAEPLLLQGYQGMNEREVTIPAPAKTRLAYALARLVSLYESRNGDGDAEKAAKYHKLLDQRKEAEAGNKNIAH